MTITRQPTLPTYHLRLCMQLIEVRVENFNRILSVLGIMIEGIACVIAGALGSGNGTTTYSENIATLRITKCASRRMIQTAALILFILGFFGKFTAFFTTLPEPVIGGLYFVMFGLITGVGISNLKYCDLGSSRNVFVFGFSIFLGLALPFWSERHPNSINTGSTGLDQVINLFPVAP